MRKPYQLSLHIFRRDLRLHDNSALIAALESSDVVIPCFIFDSRQITNNDYQGEATLQFMANSLKELDETLQKKGGRLFQFQGIAEEIVDELLRKYKIDAVFINRDYTPFSLQRDANIEAACRRHERSFHLYSDALLHEPEACLKANQQPYTIFTPFFKNAALLPVDQPVANNYKNYYQSALTEHSDNTLKKLLAINNPALLVKGGRQEALTLLKNISRLRLYHESRNFPDKPGTSHLSAHHKFGTISIRETHAKIVDEFSLHHTLINELYWRDFFTHIGFHFPRVFKGAFNEKYDAIKWHHSNDYFKAWCEGKTGFPIVDAGMRELNATGYMHNRVRMITASFLTKDLHVDWHLGEKYFAQQLVDYDPAVNNGNWQWSASTGCDAQPYFRIFNPWLQQKKFDAECTYIKRWIPELAHLEAKAIHQLENTTLKSTINYPAPIVNHQMESRKSKELFKI